MPLKRAAKTQSKHRRKSFFTNTKQPTRNTCLTSAVKSAVKQEIAQDVIKRPTPEVYKVISSLNTDPLTVPTKLRPEKEKENKEFWCYDDIVSEENIIINYKSLCDLISQCMTHRCPYSKPSINISKRMGLCISLSISCSSCSFNLQNFKLFTECENKGRGPPAGSINEGLILSTTKTKVGPSDLSFILSCMNIRHPSLSNMYKKMSTVCDEIQKLNEEQMISNQQFVKDCNKAQGLDNSVDVETDTSYNNRPTMGYEAGTQAFAPVLEKNTGLNLPISSTVANKHCLKRKTCNHQNNSCKKTYGTDESISSCETKLAQKNLEKIHNNKILKIRSVTSDACSQVGKTVRECSAKFGYPIQHFHCFVHKMRTVQRNLQNVKLITSLPPGYDRDFFRRHLASIIRTRVRLELVRINKFKSLDNFVQRADTAIKNVIPCFSGRHQKCRENSMVCCAHLAKYSPKFLPYGKHLSLCREDEQNLMLSLKKSLSLDILSKLSRLLNTNQSESMHRRAFTYAPKSNLWSRNFESLCHSALHSSTFGTGKSLLLLARARGLKFSKNDPIFRQMMKKDIKAQYHKTRKQSREYVSQQFFAKKRKFNRKVSQQSIYTNAEQNTCEELNFAININK